MSTTTHQAAHPGTRHSPKFGGKRRSNSRLRGENVSLAIAKALDINVSTAYYYVADALEETMDRSGILAMQVRMTDLARMDEMIDALWDNKADPQIAHVLLRTFEQRAKLTGANSPVQWQGGAAPETPIDEPGVVDLSQFTLDQKRRIEANFDMILQGVELPKLPAITTPVDPAP